MKPSPRVLLSMLLALLPVLAAAVATLDPPGPPAAGAETSVLAPARLAQSTSAILESRAA